MIALDGSEISSQPIWASADGSLSRDNCTDLEFYGAFSVNYQLIRSWEEGYAVVTTRLNLQVTAVHQTETWVSGADTTLTSAVDVECITPRTVLVPSLLADQTSRPLRLDSARFAPRRPVEVPTVVVPATPAASRSRPADWLAAYWYR